MESKKRWILGMFFVGLGLFLGTGCNKAGTPVVGQEEEVMLAKLSMIRSHHRQSEIALQNNERDKALAELDAIFSIQFPRAFRAGHEAILDAWSRKATLLLKFDKAKEALRVVDEGIARSAIKESSFYLAHLHYVRGQVLEALQRHKDAVVSYQKSIAINKEVIRRAEERRRSRSTTSH